MENEYILLQFTTISKVETTDRKYIKNDGTSAFKSFKKSHINEIKVNRTEIIDLSSLFTDTLDVLKQSHNKKKSIKEHIDIMREVVDLYDNDDIVKLESYLESKDGSRGIFTKIDNNDADSNEYVANLRILKDEAESGLDLYIKYDYYTDDTYSFSVGYYHLMYPINISCEEPESPYIYFKLFYDYDEWRCTPLNYRS
jgi:hypothetical protein